MLSIAALLISFFACSDAAKESHQELWITSAPAGSQYCILDPDGITIDPFGRIIKPRGKTFRVAPHPYGLVLSPDGNIAICANSGTGPFSITIFKNIFGDNPEIRQIPEGAKTDEDLLSAVFMGLAVSPDNKYVYVAGGQENKVYVFDLNTYSKVKEINLAVVVGDRDYTHGYIGDMILSRDGKTLYAVDQIGFRVAIIDVESGKIRHNIPVGRYPFGIMLTKDENALYVANVGVFEYKPYNSANIDNLIPTSADYPAFAYGSKEMVEGIKNDSVDIPGLGDPNVDEAFSVWKISLGDEPKVIAKIKTGFLVGEVIEGIPAVGGSSPNSIAINDKYVFISNGNNDCVSVIDIEKDSIIKNISIELDIRMRGLRGIIPFGLALSPDNKMLYVACSGVNAVAFISTETLEVEGFVPVGWFPSKLAVSNNGKKLVVANAKGYGSGPNGGNNFTLGPEGSNIGRLMKGSITVMDIPEGAELARETQNTIDYNFKFTKVTPDLIVRNKDNPIPLYPGEKKSPIKYIVFISKENRTYDEVFGQIPKGRGDKNLARYGLQQSFSNTKGDSTVANADVMVNHWQLARTFAISDNFYVNSDHSADGHRWLVNTYPNQWVETAVSAAYGGKRDMKPGSKAPGNYAFVGASGAIYPEDYNQHGSIWEHLERNNIEFFNFGFGMELAPSLSDSTMKYTGVKHVINFPVPGPLFDRSSKKFATYNMAIPDQFRADMFIEEFNERWVGEGKDMPQVITIMLPNDHGADDRPWAGYPFRESYMADNDLALGRVIEFLSQTKYWKNMAIFITEDDSQDGVDHIDAHRSILMVVSPYAKKDFVSHVHSSFGSIFKTMWNILGIPYLNQYDAGASDLRDIFTSTPDFSPYYALPVDIRIFDPTKALKPFDEGFDWKAVVESPKLDYPEDFIKSADARDKKIKGK